MTDQSDDVPTDRPPQPVVIHVSHAERVDTVVIQHVAGLSRRRVRALFECRAIHVNHHPVRKGDRVRPGDVVTVDLGSLSTALIPEPALPAHILDADDAIVAVDKPAGMPSLARNAQDRGTLANFLIAHFPELASASPNPLEAGLVHRLDTATSGVMLAARSRDAYLRIRPMFVRSAIKDYLAVVHGVGSRTGRLTMPIAHDPKRARRMRVVADIHAARAPVGRQADTAFRTIAQDGEGACLAVRIRTGVRHQIRAHLAAIQRPIVGDPIYGHRAGEDHLVGRLLLHAYRLRLPHPSGGLPLDLVAELPFAAVLSARGWRLPRRSDWDDL